MAHAAEAKSICGNVRLPNTWCSRPSASTTASTSAASSKPSTLSRINSSCRCPSASAVRWRSSSTVACSCWRRWGWAMRIKRQGCINPTLGAWCAALSKRSSTSGATLPPAKWRMSRRSKIARYTAFASCGLNAAQSISLRYRAVPVYPL